MEAEPCLLSSGRYFERNPLAASRVSAPWAYRWSSGRAYAQGEQDALLAPNPWYDALAAEPSRRVQLWQEFVLGEDPKEEVVRREDGVVDSEGFRWQMQRQRARPAPWAQGRPSAAPAGRSTGHMILQDTGEQ